MRRSLEYAKSLGVQTLTGDKKIFRTKIKAKYYILRYIKVCLMSIFLLFLFFGK